MRRVMSLLGIVALMLAGRSARADDLLPCDFLTGGGYIITTASDSPAHGNFGVGGSCKQGGDGHGLWGHLEYHDHGTGLNVHWLTVTGYVPLGLRTRLICGTARTNQTSDEVNWFVTATDNSEPGKYNDIFTIQIFTIQMPELVYSQAGPLEGGNIQLHKPNKSTGFFGPNSSNCECPPGFQRDETTGQCIPIDID